MHGVVWGGWGVYMAGGMHGVCVCVWGVMGGGACMAGEMATAADSTHPTGMHSCHELNCSL